METLSNNTFNITPMTADDLDAATEMRLQSWLDTYVNEAAGVTKEWIEARNEKQRSHEAAEARKERLLQADGTASVSYVAKDASGKIIGLTTPYRDSAGAQHVGSLYVDKEWHGRGVGSALMQRVLEWADPTKDLVLGVATYNERAKAFYRKWGFEEVEGSETLFADKIPEVIMVRKGDI